MEGSATDQEIRDIIEHTAITKIDEIIREFIHDERNQQIAIRKIIKNEPYDPLSESFGLSPRQCKNIVKQARRIIYKHL